MLLTLGQFPCFFWGGLARKDAKGRYGTPIFVTALQGATFPGGAMARLSRLQMYEQKAAEDFDELLKMPLAKPGR